MYKIFMPSQQIDVIIYTNIFFWLIQFSWNIQKFFKTCWFPHVVSLECLNDRWIRYETEKVYCSSIQVQILFHHSVFSNYIMFKHDCKAVDEKMCECFPVASTCSLVLALPVLFFNGEHLWRHFSNILKSHQEFGSP